jgi:hypothetical protein
MRYNSFRDPSRAASDGGLFDTELVLKPPPPYEPEPAEDAAEEDALRLAPLRGEGEEPPPKRRRAPPSRRALVLSGWALALTAALGLGYATQAGRQPIGSADAPPAVAPAPDGLGEPVTAPPIASDPSRFTQAEAAPEVNPPTEDARPQVAQATPEPAPPPAAATPAAAASAPMTLAQADGADQVQEPAQATRTSALAPDEADDAAPVKKAKEPDKPKAAKVETASAASRTVKAASDTTKPADAKDLPQLKARMSRAYAQAVKAGTPRTVLKARQAEWAVLYAKAEKKGPAAVTALYRARAAQLEAIAKKSAKGQHAKA